MNKGVRISIAVVVILGTLALAGGQMVWAGSLPAALPAVGGSLAQTGLRSAASQGSGELTATLSEIEGTVQVEQAGETSLSSATDGYVLKINGQVQTGSDSKVRLDLSTGSIVRVGPNTRFKLQQKQDASNGFFANFQLSIGKLWVTLTGGQIQVETTSGVAAVQGSLMTVTFDPTTGEFRIVCIETTKFCFLENAAGIVQIITGQNAVTHSNTEFPKIGPINQADNQDFYQNNPGAGGAGPNVVLPGTVIPPGGFIPVIAAPGTFSVGGVCTFRVLQALSPGYSLTADLLPFQSLGKNPPEIVTDLAGVCRGIYTQQGHGVIDSLSPTNGQVEVCFASVPNTNGVIYAYNPYQTDVGPAQGEVYTALETKPDNGLLCAPAQLTGKYFLANVKQ